MNMHDISTEAMVIDASGRSPEEIINRLESF
jgi:hypothetical protein